MGGVDETIEKHSCIGARPAAQVEINSMQLNKACLNSFGRSRSGIGKCTLYVVATYLCKKENNFMRLLIHCCHVNPPT